MHPVGFNIKIILIQVLITYCCINICTGIKNFTIHRIQHLNLLSQSPTFTNLKTLIQQKLIQKFILHFSSSTTITSCQHVTVYQKWHSIVNTALRTWKIQLSARRPVSKSACALRTVTRVARTSGSSLNCASKSSVIV